MKLSRYDQELKDALDSHAAELGLTGVFETGHKHNKYRVTLPDGSVVVIPVFKSPKGDAQSYGKILQASMKRHIMENLKKRGIA